MPAPRGGIRADSAGVRRPIDGGGLSGLACRSPGLARSTREEAADVHCGSGFWGGQRPSLAHYVTGMGPMDGATAAGGRSCCLSSCPCRPPETCSGSSVAPRHSNGIAALELLEAEKDVRLLFTDVRLPGGLNGRQLADEARRCRPDLLVLFTTGYTRNAIIHQERLDPGAELIGKPFTYATLVAKIQRLLRRAA